MEEPGFRLYWISTLATYAASQMDMMIKGWLIFKMTGLAADLGIVTLAAGVPLIPPVDDEEFLAVEHVVLPHRLSSPPRGRVRE